MYTVKQVSEIMNISPYALRFYDNEGLLPTLKRGTNGIRHFSAEDLQWVYIIKCFRETGLSIVEIREYVESARKGDISFRERYDFMLRQKERVIESMEALKRQMRTIDMKIEYYRALMNGEDATAWLPDIDSMVREAEERTAATKKSGSKPGGKIPTAA